MALQHMALQHDIMDRVHADGRGARVYTPKDFLDLGSRAGVDQALSRLVKAGTLRRVTRGLYDWPRQSAALKRPAPASLDAVLDAIRRRFNVFILPGNLAAANALGLTHAVPTQPNYIASRRIGDVRIGGRRLHFAPAGTTLSPWLDSPAAPVVQALVWLHDRKLDDDKRSIVTLGNRSSPSAKAALARRLSSLPGWAIPLARNIVGNHAKGGQ